VAAVRLESVTDRGSSECLVATSGALDPVHPKERNGVVAPAAAAVTPGRYHPAMPSLDPALLRWAVREAAPGADVVEVRGQRDGGSPWLLRLDRGGTPRGVVLRVGGEDDHPPLRTEVAALRLAAEHGIPAPRLLAAELVDDRPVVLVERLAGSSQIPPERPPARLRTLGRVAAALHAVALAPGPALPWRDRPIAGEDFAALRRQQPARPRTSPTGTSWPRSARRPTWAGSPAPSPGRAGPTSPGRCSSTAATRSSGPPSTGWTPATSEAAYRPAARRASGTPAANSRRRPSSPATMPSPSTVI
jgi:hypothetical protein